jgi:hypothetical protein
VVWGKVVKYYICYNTLIMSLFKFTAAFLFLLASLQAFAQPTYIRSASLPYREEGNIYAADGHFYRQRHGTGTNGLSESSILKFTADSNLVWMKTFSNTVSGSFSYISNFVFDSDGNILLCGFYQRLVDFDPGADTLFFHPNNVTGPPNGMFMVKLNSNGNLLWGKSINSHHNQNPIKVSLDSLDNIYIALETTGRIDCDPGPDSTIVGANTTYNNSDMVLLKYTSTGYLLFAGEMGSTNNGNDNISEMIMHKNAIYISGGYCNVTDFDLKQGTHNLSAQGLDMFIAKYDLDLNLIWVKNAGGSDVDGISEMALHDTCLYVAGIFENTIDFDFGPGVHTLSSEINNPGIFTGKYTLNGDLIWVRQILRKNATTGLYGIDVDSAGNVIVAGYYDDSLRVNENGQITAIYSNGLKDGYLLNYKPNGDLQWFVTLGGLYDDYITGIKIDSTNNILYIIGSYGGTVDFDFGPDQHIHTATSTVKYFAALYNLPPPVIDTTEYFADIITFTIPGQIQSIVNPATQSVVVIMPAGTNITALTPTIGISPQANINPPSGTPQDFTWLMNYTVTSFDSLVVKDWGVAVTVLNDVKEGTIKQIALYPNPTNGLLTISTDNLNDVGFQLCDITGRVLFTQQLTNATTQVDVSHFAHGLYFCRFLSNGNVVGTKKVVVN